MLIPSIFLFSIILFFFLTPTTKKEEKKKEEKKKNPEQELADAIAKYMSQTKKA